MIIAGAAVVLHGVAAAAEAKRVIVADALRVGGVLHVDVVEIADVVATITNASRANAAIDLEAVECRVAAGYVKVSRG